MSKIHHVPQTIIKNGSKTSQFIARTRTSNSKLDKLEILFFQNLDAYIPIEGE